MVELASRWHHILKNDYWGIVAKCEPFRLEITERELARVFAHFVDCLDERSVKYLRLKRMLFLVFFHIYSFNNLIGG